MKTKRQPALPLQNLLATLNDLVLLEPLAANTLFNVRVPVGKNLGKSEHFVVTAGPCPTLGLLGILNGAMLRKSRKLIVANCDAASGTLLNFDVLTTKQFVKQGGSLKTHKPHKVAVKQAKKARK